MSFILGQRGSQSQSHHGCPQQTSVMALVTLASLLTCQGRITLGYWCKRAVIPKDKGQTLQNLKAQEWDYQSSAS